MTSGNTWVDFRAVKKMVSLSQVLSHYGINWLRKQGEEQRGKCPFRGCGSQDGFHVNIRKGGFQCFGSCKRRGNLLDFTSAMEGCSVRDAAVKLAEWFAVSGSGEQVRSGGEGTPETSFPTTRTVSTPEMINKPLSFQLRGIDPAHPYLKTRGISPELAAQFGCGFFSGRGSMQNRTVFPIHNGQGELVAYAGRAVDGTEGKYKFPSGFHKSLELFNLHRAADESNKRRVVVVVEGFFDCLKVSAAGFPCVALMGSSLSETQQELLGTHFKACWLMLDGDDAGKQGTVEMLPRLSRSLWVRQAVVPEGKQPDGMTTEELHGALGKMKTPL